MGRRDPRSEHTSVAVSLLSAMASDSFGEISPSIYETARLVTLMPWLVGHAERLRFVVRSQHRGGWWGGDDGYRLVPTLSAAEALLTSLRRDHDGHGRYVDHGLLISAVTSGLRVLFEWLNSGRGVSLPDTVAVEILVPALVADINAHLDLLGSRPLTGLDQWAGSARLALPEGTGGDLLAQLRDGVRQGHALPAKLLHSVEAVGGLARGLSSIQPVRGAVGCSPAATAAWLGVTQPLVGQRHSVAYLEAVQDRHGGPVPVCAPVPVFERSWVMAALISAGVRVAIPDEVTSSVDEALGEFGAAAGPGLPPDSDDTAVAQYALMCAGRPRSPDCLWSYQVDRHFSSFARERTWSTSANAHVLQAFGAHEAHSRDHSSRFLTAIGELSAWLTERQRSDGSWADKWHASPYYATASCAVALARYGGAIADNAIRRTERWILDTQRGDGSWGRWRGTREETAYATRTLLETGRHSAAVEQAAARGCLFLLRPNGSQEWPPLWHDKDLYTPTRVVQAEVIAALSLAHANPRVSALIENSDPGGNAMAWTKR
jgi:hypothetical protein